MFQQKLKTNVLHIAESDRKMIGVSTIEGQTFLSTRAYGECQCCNVKVLYCRMRSLIDTDGSKKREPNFQWIPVEMKGDERYELHRCEGELQRNKTLAKLVYGHESLYSSRN